jgi:hypothetical protein
MGNIYTTQDSLRISLTYTADISDDISSVKIKYISPSEVEGEFNATHDAENKKVYYDLPQGTYLDEVGAWRFWIYATMTDGRVIPGEVVEQEILEEGTE